MPGWHCVFGKLKEPKRRLGREEETCFFFFSNPFWWGVCSWKTRSTQSTDAPQRRVWWLRGSQQAIWGVLWVLASPVSRSQRKLHSRCANNSLTHACMHVEVKLSRPEQKKSFNDQHNNVMQNLRILSLKYWNKPYIMYNMLLCIIIQNVKFSS